MVRIWRPASPLRSCPRSNVFPNPDLPNDGVGKKKCVPPIDWIEFNTRDGSQRAILNVEVNAGATRALIEIICGLSAKILVEVFKNDKA
jgi:hypothetical protein